MICQRREGGEGQWRLLTQARKKRTQCCTRALKYKVKVQAGFWEREKERERERRTQCVCLSLSHTHTRNRRKREDTRHSHTHTLHIYLIHTQLLYIRAHGKQQRLSSGKASFEASSWVTATEASPLFEGAAALSCLPPPPPPLARDDGCWWCSSRCHRTTAFGCVADALLFIIYFLVSCCCCCCAWSVYQLSSRFGNVSKGTRGGNNLPCFFLHLLLVLVLAEKGEKQISARLLFAPEAVFCFIPSVELLPLGVCVCFPSLRSLDIEV